MGLFDKRGYLNALYDIGPPEEAAWKRRCRLTFAAAVGKLAAALHSGVMALPELFPFRAMLAKLTLILFLWAERQASGD